MEKRIGKLLVIFLLYATTLYSDPKVTLSLLNMNMQPLEKVEVDTNFMMQIAMEDLDVDPPSYIPGMEHFQIRHAGVSHSMNSYNGKVAKTATHNYILRVDKPGSYTLGPWATRSDQQDVVSNELKFTTGTLLEKAAQHRNLEPILKAQVHKKKYYFGERVDLNIQFLYSNQVSSISFDGLNLHKTTIGSGINIESPRNKMTVDGDEYNLKEYNVPLYPEDIGRFKIDGVRVSFVDLSVNQQHLFGGLMDFFGAGTMNKTLKADPIFIDVVPLPEDENYKDVAAIGQFSKMQAQVGSYETSVGEGLALEFSVYGDGNWHKMQSMPLNLPDHIKAYESNAVMLVDDARRVVGKRFEFILQASQPGEHTIGSQRFDYFDPVEEKYKTLKTQPFTLKVKPGAHYVDPKQKKLDKTPDKQVKSQDVATQEKTYKLYDFPIHKKRIHMIKESMYKIILWILLLVFIGLNLYRYVFEKYLFKTFIWKKQRAYFVAYQGLRKAQKQNDVATIHTIFMNYFHAVKITDAGFIRDYMIADYLQRIGFDAEQVKKWNDFYQNILQRSFDLKNDQNQQQLFQEALSWLKQMKEKV